MKGDATTQSFDAESAEAGNGFQVRIEAGVSAKIAAGKYRIHYRYHNSAEEVQFVEGAEVCFLAAPTESGDTRSQFELDLAALDNAIRAKIAGGAVEEYEIHTTVGRRSLKNLPLSELREHRRWVVKQVDRERVSLGKNPISQNRFKRITSNLGNQSTVPRRKY